MSNPDFFAHLPNIHHISEITVAENYHDLPLDWIIALSDVRGSTRAIEAGRYKEVNGVAAATITALLNTIPGIDLPFVFGGDGATIVLPEDAVQQARRALIAVQRLARDFFQLELRIGLVPVRDVVAAGYSVRVAKLRMSENFQQAIFTGGGLNYAEKLLKDPRYAALYQVVDTGEPIEADFTGFECRWHELPSPHGETVSLVIQTVSGDNERNRIIYRDIIRKIEQFYGDSLTRHPIDMRRMRVATNPQKFKVETAIRQKTLSLLSRLKLMFYSIVGYFLWKYHDNLWDNYKKVVMESTDHEKFDDTLRMVISGTPEQRAALQEYLESRRAVGDIVYGIHPSQYALMTCLVFDRFGRQVHFVDGADGGYALAAKEMKSQFAALQTLEHTAVNVATVLSPNSVSAN